MMKHDINFFNIFGGDFFLIKLFFLIHIELSQAYRNVRKVRLIGRKTVALYSRRKRELGKDVLYNYRDDL